MIYGNMADRYFEDRPNVLQLIQELEKAVGQKLFKRLRTDQNDINFLSWLAEMKFGVQFNKLTPWIAYDRRMEGQRPDWLVTANNQSILAEVVRINLDEEQMTSKIGDFVSPPPHDPSLVGRALVKSLNGANFYGALWKIEKKETVYRDLIKRHRFPFIICVDCSELSLFIFDRDVADFFIADGKHGYFFTNTDFGENVTGILFRDPYNQYLYFNNPIAVNQLDKATLSFFSQTLPGIF